MYMCFLIKIVHNINSLEKCSVEKKSQYSSRTFSNFSFPGLFQAWEFIFDHFPGFQAFPVCVGTLGGKPLKYLEGGGGGVHSVFMD